MWMYKSTSSIESLGGDCLKQPSWTGGFHVSVLNRRASEYLGRFGGADPAQPRRAWISGTAVLQRQLAGRPVDTLLFVGCVYVSNDAWDWTFTTIGTDLDLDEAHPFPANYQLVH